jgi:Leucine-rich repeat (LRR) protein/class 3 adenylate cyclase
MNLRYWSWLLFFMMGSAWAQAPLDSLLLSEQTEYSNLEEATANPSKVYRLNLSQANLTTFPEEILQFGNLQVLYLGSHLTSEGFFEKGNNQIKTIPASINKLKNLQKLHLDDNLLETLPETIGDLKYLEYLSANHNKLKTLPASIGKLQKLKILVLYENRLETLPESIGNLANLQEIYLHKNKLKQLPDFIFKLTNLEDVSLSDNQIQTLPTDIGNLKKLKTLALANNQLKRLPTTVGELVELQNVNLAGNQLAYLPETIENWGLLTDLDLSENQLRNLPPSITNLAGLEELRLGSNQLKRLPEKLSGWVSLKRLSLTQNQFTQLTDSIGKLSALETIELSQNQLTSLPESLTTITSLQSLSVNQNRLTSLPESIGNLTNLKSIFAEQNQLQKLPASLEKLQSLRNLYIAQNPLQNIAIPLLKHIESSDWLMLLNLEKDMREQYINKNGNILFEGLKKHYEVNPLYQARLLNYGAWWFKENKQYQKALVLGEKAQGIITKIEQDSVKVLTRKPELKNEINETRYKIDTNVKAIKAIKDNLDLQARITLYTQIGATLLIILVVLIALLTYRNAQAQKVKNAIIEAERDKSEKLLLNILPKDVAQELKEKGETAVRIFSHTTILFADVRGFSSYASKVTPETLVNELNTMFTQMDNYAMEHKMERIKTIGDCYMAVGGCPEANTSNPVDVCLVALKIQHWMVQEGKNREGKFWEIRLGIHTGELVAGVVGKIKFAFDVWGSAVNVASRLESGGEVGKVNISATTYEFVKDFFDCTFRGEIVAKNIGAVKTYFVDRIKPELSADTTGVLPNDAFYTLYKERFGV